MALAFAPLSDSIRKKFFRPMVNGWIACSAYYPYIRIICQACDSTILRRQEELDPYQFGKRCKLCGKQLKEYCQEMQKIYPKINPKIILNRLKRTGFIEDLFAWADFGDEGIDNSDATLMLNNGDSYWLNESYDDFEQKVLNSYDSGRRV